MAPFTLSQCTVHDGAALAANNIPAFWSNPNWVLAWPHRTLDYHISQIALRLPHKLLTDRDISRHEKAVDIETCRIIGYARWLLPSSHKTNPDGAPTWPGAQVPAVEPELEAEFRRIAESLVWNPKHDDAEMVERIEKLRAEVRPKTSHITLEYLAVHPDNQRQGIATRLVESGMNQADEMGLDIFVYAFKDAVGLYRRLGFRLIAKLIQDNSANGGDLEYGAWFLLYEHGSRTPKYV